MLIDQSEETTGNSFCLENSKIDQPKPSRKHNPKLFKFICKELKQDLKNIESTNF